MFVAGLDITVYNESHVIFATKQLYFQKLSERSSRSASQQLAAFDIDGFGLEDSGGLSLVELESAFDDHLVENGCFSHVDQHGPRTLDFHIFISQRQSTQRPVGHIRPFPHHCVFGTLLTRTGAVGSAGHWYHLDRRSIFIPTHEQVQHFSFIVIHHLAELHVAETTV